MKPSSSSRGARRPTAAWAGLLILITLAGCTRQLDPVERATREVQRRDIQDYGRTLAADAMAGRRHASAEADSTVAYLSRVLNGIGIQAVSRAEDLLAGRPGLFEHYFDVTLSRPGRRTRISALCDERAYHAGPGEGFLPLVFSSPGDITGPAVLVDRPGGLRGNGASLSGRIVRVRPTALARGADETLDAALYRVALRLTELGATAVVFEDVGRWQRLAATAYPDLLSHDTLDELSTRTARRAHWTRERYATMQQARAWRLASQRTIPAVVLAPGVKLTTSGCNELRVRVAFDHEVSLGRNIVVTFPGAARPQEGIVLTAHYDQAGITRDGNVVRGADDNATGVAALLGVAKALWQVRDGLERSIVLAFVGAELLGGLGTEALLQDWPRLLGTTRPQACVALEAVGANGPAKLQVVGSANGDAIRLFEPANQRPLLDAGALLLEPRRFRAPAPGADFELGPHVYTLALWRDAGVPSWALHDGAEPRSLDAASWDTVDAGKVTRVARLVFRTAFGLSRAGRDAAWPATVHR